MKQRILVVEDQVMLSMELKAVIEQAGYTCTGCVKNARDCLNHLTKQPVDLVLMDIQLEGSPDGINTALEVEKRYNIPVLFISGNAKTEDIDRVMLTQTQRFVQKPFNDHDLLTQISLAFSSFNAVEVPHIVHTNKHGEILRIPVNDICYIKADRMYCQVHTMENNITFSLSLSAFLERYPQDCWLRIHKSYAVNKHRVEMVRKNKIIVCGASLPIGRSYSGDVGGAFG